MIGLLRYIILFTPVAIQIVLEVKHLLIVKGKIVHPLYDTEQKKNYLFFQVSVNFIFCGISMMILLQVLVINQLVGIVINPFAIFYLLLSVQYGFLGGSLILIRTNKIGTLFYDSKEKKRKALIQGLLLVIAAFFISFLSLLGLLALK